MIKRIALAVISTALIAACVPTQAVDPARFACASPTDLPNGHLVVFGEVHGTVETPALVGEYVCSLASKGNRVTLGLEIPSEEQSRLNNYMTSNGLPSDRSKLLTGQFWTRELQRQDGRSSSAVLKLIDRARQIKVNGGNIRLVAIDKPSANQSRDASMATVIKYEMAASPDADFVVLTGNVHASKAKESTFGQNFQSTAFYLIDASPITILVAFRKGTAWVCMTGSCGSRRMHSSWANERTLGYLNGASQRAGFDGIYLLDTITASPPTGLPRNEG